MMRDRTLPRLPPESELIALREVDGMAPWTPPPSGAPPPASRRQCPPGEGAV